jgi:hypothetical protein
VFSDGQREGGQEWRAKATLMAEDIWTWEFLSSVVTFPFPT